MPTPSFKMYMPIALAVALCFSAVGAIAWVSRDVDGPLWYASAALRGLITLGTIYWVVSRLPNPLAGSRGGSQSGS